MSQPRDLESKGTPLLAQDTFGRRRSVQEQVTDFVAEQKQRNPKKWCTVFIGVAIVLIAFVSSSALAGLYLRIIPSHVEIPELGVVQGVLYPSSRTYRGIRYGVAKRFEPPEPSPAWKPATYDASLYKPGCMHGGHQGPEGISEDCLYLNIFTPLWGVGDKNHPVLLWWHGGGYTLGASSDTAPEDVHVLVDTHNLVVVSANYRLGVFGFSGSEKLRSLKDNSTGNFGMQDQALAMTWVQKYISNFGGNPHQVTVIGWSAGAASISVHLTAASSRGLFQRAIMMSGGFTDWAALPMSAGESAFASVVKCLGCNMGDRACLMEKKAETVLNCGIGGWYGPVVDGVFLTKSPLDAAVAGDDIVDYSVPIIIGSALLDKLYDIGIHADDARMRSTIAFQMAVSKDDAVVDEAMKLYPLDTYMDHPEIYPMSWSPQYWATREMFADRDFTCVMRSIAARWQQKGKSSAYWYSWVEPQVFSEEQLKALMLKSEQNAQAPNGGNCYPCPGAGHGADLAFLFENADKVDLSQAHNGRGGLLLSDRLQNFYVDFAWSADPNNAPIFANADSEVLPKWYPYRIGNAMEFVAAASHEEDHYRAERCEFWDAHPKKR